MAYSGRSSSSVQRRVQTWWAKEHYRGVGGGGSNIVMPCQSAVDLAKRYEIQERAVEEVVGNRSNDEDWSNNLIFALIALKQAINFGPKLENSWMVKLEMNLAMSVRVKKLWQEVTEVRRELTGAIQLTSQVVEQRLVGPNAWFQTEIELASCASLRNIIELIHGGFVTISDLNSLTRSIVRVNAGIETLERNSAYLEEQLRLRVARGLSRERADDVRSKFRLAVASMVG